MQTMTRRIYGTDETGKRVLLCAPGSVVTDAQAKRIDRLADPEPEVARGWWTTMERRDETPTPTPTKALDRMTVAELVAVCTDEEIDPSGANTRAEYRATIEAGRAAAVAHSAHSERQTT